MIDGDLGSLLGHIFVQSFLAIGGIYVILAELHRIVVLENLWLTDFEFTSLFALAQASPGPNTLFITLIGWRLSGVTGALLATLVFVLPSFLLAGGMARAWNRWTERRWFITLRQGLVPLTIGLIVSSAALLVVSAAVSPAALGLSIVAAVVSLSTRMHPVAILAGAAVVGGFGLVG